VSVHVETPARREPAQNVAHFARELARSTDSGRNSILPDSIFARSSTSLMRWSRCFELVRMSPRYSSCSADTGPTLPRCISSANPMIALSGVRSFV